MSGLPLLNLFQKNVLTFRTAISANDTNKICRILDVKRDNLSKGLDRSGNTALLLAIKYASPLTIRFLLEQGAHPDQPNLHTSQTPLSLLALTFFPDTQSNEAKNALEMATILLDHGAYVDKPSPYMYTNENNQDYIIKETPLMTAVKMKNLPMVKLFIERKANVNYFDKLSENRPIHYSITNGDLVMFDLLINAGALCNSLLTTGENTLLHWFCSNKGNDKHTSLLTTLISKGCDVNAVNSIKRTPIMLAAKFDMINTCYTLINADADVDKIDHKGYRAIDFAKSDSECLELLYQAVHIQENKSRPPAVVKRILWKKKLNSHCISNESPINENKTRRRTSSIRSGDIPQNEHNSIHIETDCEQGNEQIDRKHKTMREKLFQKHKVRLTRTIPSQTSTDCSPAQV